MSAFNDYCIVCEKLCSHHSVYCSDECKLKDNDSHFNFFNVPQLISPILQPRSDSLVSTLSTIDSKVERNGNNDDDEETPIVHDYLIKSPLLLSSNTKDHITGLSLDNYTPNTQSKTIPINKGTNNTSNKPASTSSVMQNSASNKLNQQNGQSSGATPNADLLASSSNYKKWLNVVL